MNSPKRLSFVLLLLFLSFFCYICIYLYHYNSESLVFEPSLVNIGNVDLGLSHPVAITLRNHGKTIQALKVQSSCACAVLFESTKKIIKNETFAFNVPFPVPDQSGPFSEKVLVDVLFAGTNKEQRYEIPVLGKSVRSFTVTPKVLSFEVMPFENTLYTYFSIDSLNEYDWDDVQWLNQPQADQKSELDYLDLLLELSSNKKNPLGENNF